MRRLNADLIHVVASAGLPALVNFAVAALALHLFDPVLVGRSYALLALFYVAIDVFNFGSARIYAPARASRPRPRSGSACFAPAPAALPSVARGRSS